MIAEIKIWTEYGKEYSSGVNFIPGTEAQEHFVFAQRIPILFFTPEMTRSLAVRNSLAPFFADALRRVQAMPEWSMKDFNAAREVVYAKYPTVTKLWNALQRVK